VLLLGTGIGSALQILQQLGYAPHCTLVEHDSTVLGWAMELTTYPKEQLLPVCIDASRFMNENTEKYDLILIDIFSGKVVPPFVTTNTFLQQCKDALLPGGHLSLNYIVMDDAAWDTVRGTFETIFAGCHIISIYTNRLLIA
jgi:spermidine synthase